LFACVLIAGCSGARVVYGQLDVLISWYLRDYLDLDTDQRHRLGQAVDSLLLWHRESELRRYVGFFRQLGREAAEPLGLERIRSARFELDRFWDDIARQAAPEAAALLSSLSQAQVEELFMRMAQDDVKLAREATEGNPAERVRKREKALLRQVERWVGRLDGEQKALVRACALDLRADPEGWIASRRAWTSALREAMNGRHDLETFTPRLAQLLADGEVFWDPGYRSRFEADRERVLRLLADVDRSLSSRQRQVLQERLERWADEFESIANAG